MRTDHDLHRELFDLDEPLGDRSLALRLGSWVICLEGMDQALAALLSERWGGFLHPTSGQATATLRILRSGREGWLTQEAPTEVYRVEAINEASHRVVLSYGFAVCRDEEPESWRLALAPSRNEPLDRMVENAVRYLVARMAVARGGFALHGAGVLHDGSALIFAGPSGSGKTTAVSLLPDVVGLGDDFAFVLPVDNGWVAAAVPFDNAERSESCPVDGWVPVEAIWRLYKSDELRLAHPSSILAAASLVSCVALPWTMPELSQTLMKQVQCFVSESTFAHLHFRVDSDLSGLVAP